MKVTVVPAQITTVEDRIIGKLGLSQLLLLVAPIFGACALYLLLPPNMHSSPYKVVIMSILVVLCSVMAIRIKGRILLLWAIVLLQYGLRPRYYIFNKNSTSGRDFVRARPVPAKAEATKQSLKQPLVKTTNSLTASEIYQTLQLLDNPAANLKFEFNKKGVLSGLITEVEK